MRRFPRNLPLTLGLLLSLALHAAVILPMLMRTMTLPRRMPAQLARFDPEDFTPPDETPPPPPVEPGIDADTPSSLTWIGYEEYEEHLAQQAAFEQAAFTETPRPEDGGRPVSAQETASPVTPQPDEAETEPTEDEPAEPSAPTVADRAIFEGWIDQLIAMAGAAPGAVVPTAPTEGETSKPSSPAADPKAPDAKASETPDTKTEEKTAQAGDAAKPGKETPLPPEPGEQSDQESPPTSIDVPLDEIKLGHPIARAGLVLKPKRPHFTTLTVVTSAPSNPLVEMKFAASGKPAQASIVESSGDSRIDFAIETSLYRWRAEGKPLAKLQKGQTIDIRIRIVLR